MPSSRRSKNARRRSKPKYSPKKGKRTFRATADEIKKLIGGPALPKRDDFLKEASNETLEKIKRLLEGVNQVVNDAQELQAKIVTRDVDIARVNVEKTKLQTSLEKTKSDCTQVISELEDHKDILDVVGRMIGISKK